MIKRHYSSAFDKLRPRVASAHNLQGPTAPAGMQSCITRSLSLSKGTRRIRPKGWVIVPGIYQILIGISMRHDTKIPVSFGLTPALQVLENYTLPNLNDPVGTTLWLQSTLRARSHFSRSDISCVIIILCHSLFKVVPTGLRLNDTLISRGFAVPAAPRATIRSSLQDLIFLSGSLCGWWRN